MDLFKVTHKVQLPYDKDKPKYEYLDKTDEMYLIGIIPMIDSDHRDEFREGPVYTHSVNTFCFLPKLGGKPIFMDADFTLVSMKLVPEVLQ